MGYGFEHDEFRRASASATLTTVGRTWQMHPTVPTSYRAPNQSSADVSSKPRFSSIGSTDGSRPRNVLKAVAGSIELPTL
jgi:hypothetical protein